MDGEQRPSTLARFISVAFFLILTLSSLTWFTVSIIGFISQFLLNDPVVEFDKGSMYMLGIGLGLLLLTIGGVMQGLLGKKLTPQKETLFTRGLVFSLIIMFGFPHLTHYVVANYAQQRNYSVCSDASYRWLLYSKFYYTKNGMACNKLVSKKEITKSSSGR
ncbi:hypothetical protein MNBD_GAMMA17-1731 [hydrothermal vent metagenome]|uniref:Uncharacterized protein n=1 Tax=hydrothermal vent metagenome TaxID=652676 RepID=A0A3B0ZX17_9ZZZZ